MKKILLILLTGLFMVFIACEKDEIATIDQPGEALEEVVMGPDGLVNMNKKSTYVPPVIPKTVNMRNGQSSSLTPDELVVDLYRGQTYIEDKDAMLWLPKSADILFFFDISYSMNQEIDVVKTNATNIATNIRNGNPPSSPAIPDSRFGITAGCDEEYTPLFEMHCVLTDNIGLFAGQMVDVEVNNGGYEQYGEQFRRIAEIPGDHEWREGNIPKILVAFLDENPDAADGPPASAPGQIFLIEDAIELLGNRGIIPIIIYSRDASADRNENGVSDFVEWDNLVTPIGGCAFEIGSDGSLPNQQAIEDFIRGKIEQVLTTINVVNLSIPPEWMNSCVPSQYPNAQFPNPVVVPTTSPLPFTIEFIVPGNADFGPNEFQVVLLGDGVEYAAQDVTINVLEDPEEFWPMDVKPTSCPNPINRKSKGKIPLAILGTDYFDVTTIMPGSVKIIDPDPDVDDFVLAETNWSFSDVATPFYGELVDQYSCTTEGGDGYMDLVLHFKTKDVAELPYIAAQPKGAHFILHVEFTDVNGITYYTQDVMWVKK